MEDKHRIELNIIPFLAESFSTNKRIYKDIDKIYNTDKIKFIEKAKENIYYNHKMAQEGSIEQEYYFKKSLGIIKCSEGNDELSDEILKIFKKGWRYAYTYIENHSYISVSDFLNKLVKKKKGIQNITDDEMNSNVLILLYLSQYFNKQIDIEDQFYQGVVDSYIMRLEHYKNENRISINNISKDNKKRLRDLELKLMKNNKHYLHPCNFHISSDKYVGMGINTEKLTKDEKYYTPYNYIFDLDEMSLVSIIGDDYLKSKDVQELIFCYTQFVQKDEEVNFEELQKFLYPAIQIKYLAREYMKAKKYFFKNFDEELYNEISKVENENKEELIKLYKNYCNRIGKIATCTDLDNDKTIYDSRVFLTRFTSIQKLRRLAGLEYETSNSIYTTDKTRKSLIDLYLKYNGRLTTSELNIESRNIDNLPSITLIPSYMKCEDMEGVWQQIEGYLAQEYCKMINQETTA